MTDSPGNDEFETDAGAILKTIPESLIMALLDNPYESMILIDADGIVRYMSPVNEGVYRISPKASIGRHITEVSPKTQMLRVLKTGKAEIGRGVRLKNQERIIARIPLTWNNTVIGVVGKLMFASPENIRELYRRIDALKENLDYYKKELGLASGTRYTFDNIIGNAGPVCEAKALARQAAENDAAVLITGESGTGKELFAHSIHQASQRARHNFIRINCAAIPNELIESELFGYEEGAFTGAQKKGRPGKFELAEKGTVFLDEIGDMPTAMQVKLMRVLQEKEVERIGSGRSRRIDFRLISATNRDLQQLSSSGFFRLDLYYRLNVLNIKLPPLRAIKEDIPTLFTHFLTTLSQGKKHPSPQVAEDVVTALQNYSWPGNIRELRNIAERAMIVCRGDRIELSDLPISLRETAPWPGFKTVAASSLKTLMEETERQAIIQALEASRGNRVRAAALLGIHRTGLYQKMRKYGVK
ncbi:sigma 54-interacting transcriptional regulator [Desulfosarcina sp. OttesenSCG-928-G17]|nr:sigma 54-interacting transcriptional regulator [Desulfosarcina sp. OttesenSCG-928-G17]